MAVIAVWQCDRDGTMFQNKKDAEEYDKMLELAENITAVIEQHVKGVSAEHSEAIGLLLAQNREALAKACKGKPEALLEEVVAEQPKAGAEEPKSNKKVASISAKS